MLHPHSSKRARREAETVLSNVHFGDGQMMAWGVEVGMGSMSAMGGRVPRRWLRRSRGKARHLCFFLVFFFGFFVFESSHATLCSFGKKSKRGARDQGQFARRSSQLVERADPLRTRRTAARHEKQQKAPASSEAQNRRPANSSQSSAERAPRWLARVVVTGCGEKVMKGGRS